MRRKSRSRGESSVRIRSARQFERWLEVVDCLVKIDLKEGGFWPSCPCARMGGLCGACVRALADFGGVKSRRLDRPQRNARQLCAPICNCYSRSTRQSFDRCRIQCRLCYIFAQVQNTAAYERTTSFCPLYTRPSHSAHCHRPTVYTSYSGNWII